MACSSSEKCGRLNNVLDVEENKSHVEAGLKLWDAASALVQCSWEEAKGNRENNASSRDS